MTNPDRRTRASFRYTLPNNLPVASLYHRLQNGICGDGALVLLFIVTVRPEPPEIHSGQLPDLHLDLGCQIGFWPPD
jgi:hypothetical protein